MIKVRVTKTVCLFATLCGLHSVCWSQTESSDLPDWLTSKITPVHYGLNEFVDNTSRGIDRFFGTDESLLVENKSFIRLGQSIRFIPGSNSTDTSLRFRLDLPTTREKLRVVIESNVSELDPLLGRDAQPNQNTDNIENAESTLGLESQSSPSNTEQWDGRVGAGIRFRSGVDPYLRYTASRQLTFDDSEWTAKSFNRLIYYNQRGYQIRSSLDFNRLLTNSLSFRALTQLDWQQFRKETSYIQSLELNQIIDQRNAMRYAILFLGDTAQQPSLFDKVLQVYWRRDIHNKFIYLDVVPEYHWPGSHLQDPYLSLTLRLEMFFRANFDPEDN